MNIAEKDLSNQIVKSVIILVAAKAVIMVGVSRLAKKYWGT